MYSTVQNIKIHLPNSYLLEHLVFNSVVRGYVLKNDAGKAVEVGDVVWENLKKNKTKPSSLKERIKYYFEVGCDWEDKELFLEYWKYVREEVARRKNYTTDELIKHFYENALRLRKEVLDEESKKFYLGADFEGKVYPLWSVAKTGRYYTSNPNLQGLSLEKLGKYFDLTGLSYFDFPQYEITLIAFFSQDEELIKLIEEEVDIYEYIKERFNLADRKEAKKKLLGAIYGQNESFLIFKGVKKWKRFLLEKVRKNPYIKVGNIKIFVDKEYKVWNYFIQSFGAYFIREFLKGLIKKGYKIYLYRHDGFLYKGKEIKMKNKELLYLLYLFFQKNRKII